MLQIDQFRLPIGFKFTKRLWSHQDFKRRIDYSMQIEWSNKEYFYSIQVNKALFDITEYFDNQEAPPAKGYPCRERSMRFFLTLNLPE